ncbi:hypothetical protein [Sunxiuqinia sp. sy24]|uniref:hypothetical protein n=1 Tax=Sunxiuqinia sp. sy24 TaxID=3461495 RepID=UPI0040456EEB
MKKMKEIKGWIFSRFESNRDETGQREPIQFVSCQFNGSRCVNQRETINQCLFNSHDSFTNKEYDDSIEALKIAYDQTGEISGAPCSRCAQLFRSRITDSMEQIHDELQRMTTGFFSWGSLSPSYELANTAINEFRKND